MRLQKIKVKFQYCYGIKKLEYEFNFSNRVFAIYAPNGMMKTSFARTFKDFAEQKETKDLAFPERQTIREINAEPELSPEEVFVIEPYNETFQSDKMSTLLVNENLRKKYDDIHKDIDKTKKELIKKLKQLSGLTGRKDDIEKTVESIFRKPLLDYLLSIKDKIESQSGNNEIENFNSIVYSKIFNDKVRKFLEQEDVIGSINSYIERYNELIDKSTYLKRNFTLYQVQNVHRELAKNNFFKAGHSVNMFDGNTKKEIDDEEKLNELIEEEKKKVLEDDILKQKFEEIDKKLSSNAELREFKDYLLDNREILPELVNLDEFQKKIWLSYFLHEKDLSLELIKKYEKGQNDIKTLIEQAKTERTEWENVIETFNKRFVHLPFYLEISNKEDVLLKGNVPVIQFIFKDEEDRKIFNDKDELLRILSQGEKRALYILNIIFEVEARKRNQHKSLFIIDDIADSFDYKNKYVIIDYLLHMSEVDKFYMIILTHNFDFFRTIMSRHVVSYSQCLMATRDNDTIVLEKAQYIRNPFARDWKNNLSEKKKLIASIPFLRNIIEYTQGIGNDDYMLLTSVLHYKTNTENITLQQLKEIFEKYLVGINFPNVDLDKKIIELIFETADEVLDDKERLNLENKIVLSMAIRLKAEQFMISKITDEDFIRSIESNQTWKLLKKFEEEFNNEIEKIELLKRVNLITPENIHLNSFMYEPILDMSCDELKELYREVKQL